jgi:hypothetical protein
MNSSDMQELLYGNLAAVKNVSANDNMPWRTNETNEAKISRTYKPTREEIIAYYEQVLKNAAQNLSKP